MDAYTRRSEPSNLTQSNNPLPELPSLTTRLGRQVQVHHIHHSLFIYVYVHNTDETYRRAVEVLVPSKSHRICRMVTGAPWCKTNGAMANGHLFKECRLTTDFWMPLPRARLWQL